jgi:chromosomal replication initiator protein
MRTSGRTMADSFIDDLILLDKSISNYTLGSDFFFKGGYKCLKKAVSCATETVDMAVKKQPLPINPLVIVGEVGSCKNRLLHAIWNSLAKERLSRGEPEPVAVYLQIAADFDPMSDMYAEFSGKEKKDVYKRMVERLKYIDIVFVDEIQYLEGKPESMNLLLEIAKFMEFADKPMIMTSQKTDLDKTGLVPELAKRMDNFEYIKIALPGAEDRLKMLADFLKKENLSLESERLRDIWQKNTEKYQLRSLMSKLNHIAFEAEGGVITCKTMERVFEKDFAEHILEIICEHFKIGLKTLIKEERKFAYERALAMYFIKSANRGMDFADVGKRLGRSENTVRASCDNIERILAGSKELFCKKKPSEIRKEVEEIFQLIPANSN